MTETAFRWTPQRRAILEELRQSGDHPTAAQIYQRVHRRYPRVSYGTVYRTLHLLAEKGEILELKFGAEASRFDGFPSPHHHVLCTRCGRLEDVDFPLPEDSYHRVAQQTGFLISDHRAQFQGLCPRCRAGTSPPPQGGDLAPAAERGTISLRR